MAPYCQQWVTTMVTGKSAEEMLALLTTRLKNNPQTEINMAMGEQNKITKLRLEKLPG